MLKKLMKKNIVFCLVMIFVLTSIVSVYATESALTEDEALKIEDTTKEDVKVFPSISTADGLDVSFITDKDEYDVNEIIKISYEIKNTNTYNVKNIDVTLELPEKLELVDGNNELTDISLEAGKTITGTLDAKYKVVADTSVNNEEETQKNEAVKTGDSSNALFFVVMISLSGCVMAYMIITGNKKARKFFAMFIATTVLVQSADFSVFARADELTETREINVERKIKVNNEDCSINLKVSYDYVLEKGSLSIDVSEFSYNKEGNIYEIASEISGIKGTLNKVENYDKLILNVYNQKNVLVYSAEIKPSEEWKFENVGLFAGENKIEVIAEGKDKLVEQIMLEDYFGYNFNKIPNSDVDTDKDGLSDMLEEYAGTDINDVDTDDDGLTDCQEIVDLGTSGLKTDTDGNGVSDYYEDADGDGIANGEEYVKGTSPISDDTDLDGLKDKEELEQYLTNPTLDDTDSDGGKDNWEIENGYDPLVANESFEIEKKTEEVSEYNSVSASVSLELSNGDVESLEVEKLSVTDNPFVSSTVAGYLGNAYDFSVDGEFSEAQISFEYDTNLGVIGDDFQPRIYYFNETEMTYEELPNQIVENGKVTATVTHFSTYILLNKTEFDKVWDAEIKAPIVDGEGNQAKNIDIAFVCDTSGSMDNYNRIEIAKDSINDFIDALETDDRGALVKFSSYSHVLSDFTSDKEALKYSVSLLGASGSTYMYKGFSQALNLFDNNVNDNNYKMIIILTDGYDNYSTYDEHYKHLVEKAVDDNIVVYTIGVGSYVNSSILRTIASNTNGKYYNATYADEITDQFDDIRGETVDLTTDTNEDGIPDYFSEKIKSGELVLSNGSRMFTGVDFGGVADFDGDGLKNGEEVEIKAVNGRVYLNMKSDPRFADSDRDGLGDYVETFNGSDPLLCSIDKGMTDILLDREDDLISYYYSACANEFKTNAKEEFVIKVNAAIYGVHKIKRLMIYENLLLNNISNNAQSIDMEKLQVKEFNDTLYEIADENIFGNENISGVENFVNVVDGVCEIMNKMNGQEKIAELIADSKELSRLMDSLNINIKTPLKIDEIKLPKNVNISTGFESVKNIFELKDVVGRLNDACGLLENLSYINANNSVVNYSVEVLEELYNIASNDEIKDAAKNAMEGIYDNYEMFAKRIIDQGVDKALDKVVDKMYEILATKVHPSVLFIKLTIELSKLFADTETEVVQRFENFAYDELTNAYISVLDNLIYQDGNKYYSILPENEMSAQYYLSCIAQIRIDGEKHYYKVYESGGLLAKLIKSEKDMENAKAVLNKQIESVIFISNFLGLYLIEPTLIS